MSTQLELKNVLDALAARDPDVVQLIASLSHQPDKEPEQPIRAGVATFEKYLAEITSPPFRRKPKSEQAHYRTEQIKALESPDAEVPLSDRLRLHDVIYQLWDQDNTFNRGCLLRVIASVRLTYGPWRALKRIFKEAESRGDTEVYGALAARFDSAHANHDHAVSAPTLAYLCRRAWRYLRRRGEQLPACYADIACDYLVHYRDHVDWRRTWVAAHVFYHETKHYSRRRFQAAKLGTNLVKYRAFDHLWRRSPRPFFSLLERANCEGVRRFATESLKKDFRAQLREVEPAWVARLVNVRSEIIDQFVIWVLENVPRFEQAAFRELGLHDAVIRLFQSPFGQARVYAADYARTHARDLPVDMLVRLAGNRHKAARKLAADLLQSRDPRTEIGLDAWGQLLENDYSHKLAASVLLKHFSAAELTPEWFKQRLLSDNYTVFEFAREKLPQVHPPEKLGAEFFCRLVSEAHREPDGSAIDAGLDWLAQFELNDLDIEFLKRVLVSSLAGGRAAGWVDEGRLKAETYPIEFLKMVVYHPAWEQDPWVADLKQDRSWSADTDYQEMLADKVFDWLLDERRFTAEQLGFEWLLELVQRSEPRYHKFATEKMIRGLRPAGFAPAGTAAADGVEAGCERLWQMLTEPGKADAPLAGLAREYFRHHHPDICLAETEQPVEAGAEIPAAFLTFQRAGPLFSDIRKPLRDFALELAKWEFARWAPPIENLVELCEAPFPAVREFIATALTADEEAEHARYRIDPAVLTADAVYSFCESHDVATRGLGMVLIGRHARLQLPDYLFRLTESPDRKVRAFVIRTLWSLYRERGIRRDWKPQPLVRSTVGAKAKKDAAAAAALRGDGPPPRPDELPAAFDSLQELLRRILFEIPPGRPEKAADSAVVSQTLKPLPSRKAKLHLVEVLRDLAVEDAEFAVFVLPLLREFIGSHGQSERAACLVASTRICRAHPQLAQESAS